VTGPTLAEPRPLEVVGGGAAPPGTGAAGGDGAAPTGGDGPSSVGARWRTIPRRWRIVLVVVAAVAAGDAVVAVAGSFGSGGGTTSAGSSSSFDPSAAGTQAMAELLPRFGHAVSRLQAPVAAGVVPVSSTLVVADPVTWDAGQTGALAAFLRSGGHAVLAGGPFNSSVLRTLLGTGDVPVITPVGVASARAVGSAPEVAGVSVVDADPGGGAWATVGTTTPILAQEGATLAVVADVGAGRLVLLASSSPLQNALLGDADNAAFAVDVAGGPGRPVVFDEYAHGFGAGGLGALPLRWKWALVLGALAVVLWMWSAARRFGPPEPAERALAPARVAYVDGLAAVLAATDARRVGEAVAPVHRAARSSLCRRLGVPDDTSDAEVAVVARAAGLSDELVSTALAPPTDKQHALAAGRAHSWLDQEWRSPS